MLNKPKGLTFRLILVSLVFFFVASFAFPKESLAYRSRDGGGDLVEFDFGKWALGTAAGVVSSTLGSAIVSGLGGSLGWSTDGGFMESLSSLKGADTWATNFVNSTAVGQVQNAVGMMGGYYGWDPRSTIFISSIAGGVVGGGLSPGHFGSSVGSGLGVSQTIGAGMMNTLEGMGIGLIEGTVEGAILMSAADKKGRIDPIMGNVANLAGTLVSQGLVGGLTKANEFSFSNIGDFNFSDAAQVALRTTLRSIPSAGLSMGVQSITRGMDKQDAYIIKNAFSGAYYMVNFPTGYAVDKKIMPAFFGKEPGIPITNTTIEPPPLKKALDPSSQIPLAQIPSQANLDRSYSNRQ